jgi:hypothetical protein
MWTAQDISISSWNIGYTGYFYILYFFSRDINEVEGVHQRGSIGQ